MSNVKVSIRPFNLKLKYPFGISRGSISYAKNVLLTLYYDDVIAYGEAAPSLYYGEDQNSVMDYIQSFVKYKSLEEYITNIQKLREDLTKFGIGFSSSASVAVEMAFWDLIGKINNKSLYQFFFHDDPFLDNSDGKKNLPMTSYTIGLDNLLIIEEKTKYAINSGYRILKLKLGSGFDNDLNILKTVSQLANEYSCDLRVDANGAWDYETTKKMLDLLPKYSVELLEQPLPKGQIQKLSQLSSTSSIPIFVDEDCIQSSDIECLAGKVQGINVKLMKTGSIIDAYNMLILAKSYNLKSMLGCMIESSCAISAAAHISPLADYVDLDGHLLLEHDPFCGLSLENNKILPSFDSGLGVTLVN